MTTTATNVQDVVRERNTAIAAMRVLQDNLMELSAKLVAATTPIKAGDIIDVSAIYPKLPRAMVEKVVVDIEDRRGLSGIAICFIKKDGSMSDRRLTILKKGSESASVPVNSLAIVGRVHDNGTIEIFATEQATATEEQ